MSEHRPLRLSSTKRYERNKPKQHSEPLVVSVSLELWRSTLAPTTEATAFGAFELKELSFKTSTIASSSNFFESIRGGSTRAYGTYVFLRIDFHARCHFILTIFKNK